MTLVTEINGWDVQYYNQEEESMDLFHPGCHHDIDIEKVICKGKNIIGLINLEDLKNKILKEQN